LKCILDFQLAEHEKFLRQFNDLFRQIDVNGRGVLNQEQFKFLIFNMSEHCTSITQPYKDKAQDRNQDSFMTLNLLSSPDELLYLLQMIDPH